MDAAQVFVRFDMQIGQSQSWSPGSRCFCEELIFVPGPAGAEKEDDGVLLGIVFDGEMRTSSLVVRPRPGAGQFPQDISVGGHAGPLNDVLPTSKA